MTEKKEFDAESPRFWKELVMADQYVVTVKNKAGRVIAHVFAKEQLAAELAGDAIVASLCKVSR